MSDAPTPLYCANHPQIETSLRCNRCEKPICTKCAILTPTGYRCKECVRGQQKVFETAQWYDYPLAFAVAGILAFLGSLIVPTLGFFSLFLSPVAGVIIAEAVRFAVRRRRGKTLFITAVAGVVLGALPAAATTVLPLFLSLGGMGSGGLGYLYPLIWQGIYIFMVTSTAYYRLAGIQMR